MGTGLQVTSVNRQKMRGFYSTHLVNGAAWGCVKGVMKQDTKRNYKYLSLAASAGECVKRLNWTTGFMDRSKGVCELL